MPHRSTLVLYTDGLVETHGSDLDTQINALESELRAVFATTSSLEQAADRVLTALLPGCGEPAGDVTLLLARTPIAPLASAHATLRPEPQQVAVGRRFARETLVAWQQTELADTACLLISEILTNAVRHARQTISLRLHHTAREVIAEITDDNTQLPQRTLPAPADESGRGLTLVEALAGTWGARLSSTGKTVWFTLATDTASSKIAVHRLGPGGERRHLYADEFGHGGWP